MERRGFLKLLGLGAVTAVIATTAGLDEAQAAPNAAEAKGVDQFLDELTAANKGDGEFSQYYYYRRPRRRRFIRRRVYYRRPIYYRRPVYYVRPRRCGWVYGPFGPVRRCW